MEGRKKKGPVSLSLNTTTPVVESKPKEENDSLPEQITGPARWEDLFAAVSKMDVCSEQKTYMEDFLKTKKRVVEVFGPNGGMKEEDYDRLEELGTGNGGSVFRVRHKLAGIEMARKIIYLDVKPKVRTLILRELTILHECNSPHIVGVYGNFYHNREISIVMEHMDGGSLDKILKRQGRIPVHMIQRITLAVCTGLKYLKESHGIIHRDVKPSNVLVNTKGEIKLCDFGVSGQLINSLATSFVGTSSYMAPERLLGSTYSVLSDIFSLGLSLVEMALGRYPLPIATEGEIEEEMALPPAGSPAPREGVNQSYMKTSSHSHFALMAMICKDDPPQLPEKYFSEDVRGFVSLCLRKEPGQRGDLAALLSHSFTTSCAVTINEFAQWVGHTTPSS
nr:mitogen-activated protein kinase kinase 1 [Halisarca dujardinii]